MIYQIFPLNESLFYQYFHFFITRFSLHFYFNKYDLKPNRLKEDGTNRLLAIVMFTNSFKYFVFKWFSK